MATFGEGKIITRTESSNFFSLPRLKKILDKMSYAFDNFTLAAYQVNFLLFACLMIDLLTICGSQASLPPWSAALPHPFTQASSQREFLTV